MLKRGILVWIVVTLILSGPAWADNSERLNEARALVEAGEYQQAHEAYETLYVDSADDKRFDAVRSSYLLSEWRGLAEHYPPALTALKKHQQRLLDKAGSDDFETSDFGDLRAINRALEEDDKTLEVFLQAHRDQPDKARWFYFYTGELLIDAGEYEVYLHYNPDPVFAFEKVRHNRERELSSIRLETQPSNHRRYADESFETAVTALLSALVYTERKDELAEVRRRAEAYYGEEEAEALYRGAINR